MKKPARASFIAIVSFAIGALSACSSGPQVKSQAYAKLQNHKTFEFELPVVWKGIEDSLRNYKITERDPKEVDDMEMKKLSERKLETDWVYSESRDKYEEYKINGSPRRKNLQTRIRYEIDAKRVMGGTDVTVKTHEELERIKPDGSSAGFSGVDQVDSSRAAEILDKIQQAILSAPPPAGT